MDQLVDELIKIHWKLAADLNGLHFAPPTAAVYNPLDYAFPVFERYLRRYAHARPNALFMGMNPGPWGMAQTGIPFGAVPWVRDWMGLGSEQDNPVSPPQVVHPKRPVEGFECRKVEVSGDRLWGMFAQRYPIADDFFQQHMVVNYCPLVFMEESGRNRTPDKLPAAEQQQLTSRCNTALAEVIGVLEPKSLVGVGKYAQTRLKEVCDQFQLDIPVHTILHPSPASPAANKDFQGTALRQLIEAGIWDQRDS